MAGVVEHVASLWRVTTASATRPDTVPAVSAPARTQKGEREAARLLQHAMVVLARDGVDGATLGRLAEEADTGKRMLAYYFGSRDGLLAAVVRSFAEDARDRVISATEPAKGAVEVVDVGVDALWQATTERPELLRAYLALTANHNSSEPLLDAMQYVSDTFRELFLGRAQGIMDQGYTLVDPPETFVTIHFAGLRGLLLEWAERGETEALLEARRRYKASLAGAFVPTNR